MANTNYFVVRNGISSGNTNISATSDRIEMGLGGSVSVDAATGAFVFIPAPTATYPNPQAIILTAAGTITTTTTTGGTATIASIDLAANTSAGSGSSTISGGAGYAYELDSFTCNGRDNMFPLTYNNVYTTAAMPWNLYVALDGARQPAFAGNAEPVWQSFALCAKTGFTLDTTTQVFTTNATGTLAANTVTVASSANLAVGMLVTGNGITGTTTVTDANYTTNVITLSTNLSQSITANALTFAVTNIKFSDVPVPGTICTVESVPGTQYPILKQYPFRPLDIALGY